MKNTVQNATNSCFASGRYLVVISRVGTYKLSYSDIIILKSTGHKIAITTQKGEIIIDEPLKDIAAILPHTVFLQSHRSYIVNLSHIKAILADHIIMDKENTVAYLTKRKFPAIKKIWLNHLIQES